MTQLTIRELLLMLYQTAVDAVDGRYLVQQWLAGHPQRFSHCVAIGKAAPAMLQGALHAWPSFPASSIPRFLLISPSRQISRGLRKNSAIQCIASSHPLPDEKSLQAGNQLLQFLRHLPDEAQVLFLVSGGASALVEVLKEDITLEMCRRINHYLLASGKTIQQINAWRQHYSKIKAGGLLHYIHPQHCTQLLLSDVPGDDISVIGSGLLVESDREVDKDEYLCKFFPAPGKNRMPQQNSTDGKVKTAIVGTLQQALQACTQAAEGEGLPCVIHEECLQGDVREAAMKVACYLKQAQPGIHLWGGETTVTLPERPGMGGRNQSFALQIALHLADTAIHVLAAGSDGIDGNSNCAGAAVSAYTIKKARSMGMDVAQALEKANAGMVLMATDDLIQTGPTNTNVMDIVIAYVPADGSVVEGSG